MISVFLFTLRESLYRRTGLVLLVMGVLINAVMMYLLAFRTDADGTVMVQTFGGMEASASMVVPRVMQGIAVFGTSLWIFVVLFAAAPMLAGYLEPGWIELQVSKSVPRWQIVTGVYLSTVKLVTLALLLVPGVLGFYMWARAGVPTFWHLVGGMLLLVLCYASVLALMAVVAVMQNSAILPIMVAYLVLALSVALKNREFLYDLITFRWVRFLLDWTYYVLPKTHELSTAGVTFFRTGEMEAWWPVWTTALFLLAMVGLAVLLFQRKSF